MKKSNELLIGIFVCVLLAVLYWGVNFLKGENLFSDKRFFYAVYDNINGLTTSRPVTVNGFRIGQVSNISFDSDNSANLIVQVAIEEDIIFTTNSILEIYDSDIMGTKSVQLKIGNNSETAISGDTLIGSIASGLTSEVSEQFGSVKVGVDQLIISFNKVLQEVKKLSSTANRILLENEVRMANSIENIESISEVIEVNTYNINNMLSNLSTITDSISNVNFIGLSDKMMEISTHLELLLINIDKGEGSLGKLVASDSIYNDVSNTIKHLDTLLIDIRENPKKYINISVFGGNKKNEK